MEKVRDQQAKKVLGIQYLRGLAAIAVVICHYSASLPLPGGLNAWFAYGQAGVPVFFMISGFIITYALTRAHYRPAKFFTFLLKRAIRIDPPYYLTLLVCILVYKYLATVSPLPGAHFDLKPGQLLAHIFYIVPFTPYPFYLHIFWTLCIEFQFYVLIGLLYFLNTEGAYRSIFLVVFSLTAFLPWPNAEYLVFTYAPIFAAGISLVHFYRQPRWTSAALPCLCLALTGLKFGPAVLVLLTLSAAVILFAKFPLWLLNYLGDISYSLYLTHAVTIILIDTALRRVHINVSQHPVSWLVIEVTGSLMAATILYLTIERPSLAFSRRLFYNRLFDHSESLRRSG